MKSCLTLICLICLSAATADNDKSFLIIAPESFHPALADFVTHKKAQLPTTLVSLEHVLKSTSGVDDPERLKQYLYRAWKDQKLGYVLLVGDADVLPVRYMVLDRNTEPAFNWNAQKDGFHAQYFGEVRGEHNKSDAINFDNVDYIPDIAVGRWPVSTIDEVKIVATKSIAYEK